MFDFVHLKGRFTTELQARGGLVQGKEGGRERENVKMGAIETRQRFKGRRAGLTFVKRELNYPLPPLPSLSTEARLRPFNYDQLCAIRIPSIIKFLRCSNLYISEMVVAKKKKKRNK